MQLAQLLDRNLDQTALLDNSLEQLKVKLLQELFMLPQATLGLQRHQHFELKSEIFVSLFKKIIFFISATMYPTQHLYD